MIGIINGVVDLRDETAERRCPCHNNNLISGRAVYLTSR